MSEYFSDYSNIIDLIKSIVFIIVSFFLFFKTKNVNYLKEVLKMTKETKVVKKGTTFTNLVPVYRLNKATNVVEDTGEKIDIDELVQSNLSSCLDSILSKFLAPAPEDATKDIVADLSSMQDDLDAFTSISQKCEEYKEKYNLDSSLSFQQVFDAVKKKSEDATTNYNKLKETTENESKKTIEKSE